MSCVITFPQHNIDGGQHSANGHYPLTSSGHIYDNKFMDIS